MTTPKEEWTCPDCGRELTSREGKVNHLRRREALGKCPPTQDEVRRTSFKKSDKDRAKSMRPRMTSADTITFDDINGFWT